MNKLMTVVLTAALLAAMALCGAAVAETEQESYYTYFSIDEETHLVCVETWEYPIVDGDRGSGRIVEDEEYEEPHALVDGACPLCGFGMKDMSKPEIETKPTITTTDTAATDGTAAAEETEATGGTTLAEKNTFASASGAVIAKGTGAIIALKQLLAALPADAQVSFSGVSDEAAALLKAVIDGDGSVDELLAALVNFPVQVVDGIECYIVTVEYVNPNGNAVVENYAFNKTDGTLVKLF